MSKVSVIITCFNVEEYIAVAIQSVLDTKIADLELIVVDDCSTDSTREIVNAVTEAAGVPFVPIYFTRNTVGGVASAANSGLDAASGDTVIFVDGDDWVIPDNLESAVAVHEAGDSDFTFCNCLEYWNDSGEYTRYPEGGQWSALAGVTNVSRQKDLLLYMAPFPWRKIYSRNFLNRSKIRFPVGDFFFEDNPFHWQTTVKAAKIQIFDKPTHVHRMARPGQTVSLIGAKSLKIFDHAQIIKENLLKERQYANQEHAYLAWLIKHVIWCADNVPPGFLNEVFEKSKPHLRPIAPDVFWHGIASYALSASQVRKLSAIYLDERFEFLREF